jgi:hypothetical protein
MNTDVFEESLNNPDKAIHSINDYTTDPELNLKYEEYTKSMKYCMLGLLGLNTVLALVLRKRVKILTKSKKKMKDLKEANDKQIRKVAGRPDFMKIIFTFTIPNAILLTYILYKGRGMREIENSIIEKENHQFSSVIELFKDEESLSGISLGNNNSDTKVSV